MELKFWKNESPSEAEEITDEDKAAAILISRGFKRLNRFERWWLRQGTLYQQNGHTEPLVSPETQRVLSFARERKQNS